jgi:hypothetical protein
MSDPFGEFESAAEIAGFIYRKFGADGLRRCLNMTVEGSTVTLTTEFLNRAAAELAQVGLAKAAAVVAEAATDAPSALELCPYEPGTANAISWLRIHRRRR